MMRNKILDMLRSYSDVPGDIHSYKMDLNTILQNRGKQAFEEILFKILHKLTEELISDSMVESVNREDVGGKEENYKPTDKGLIMWWLETKLNRLKCFGMFLSDSEYDFIQSLKQAEEKLIFFISIKKSHEKVAESEEFYHSIRLFNKTIKEIVK
jgi:hypothetical protein